MNSRMPNNSVLQASRSEVAAKANFSQVLYGQCWEDADVLLDGLNVSPGDTCISIASAGDNTLSLLSKKPEKVIALDLNPAQLACLELRVAAFRELSHPELLELLGLSPSQRREELYQRCRLPLSRVARQYWDHHQDAIRSGIATIGKMERYFTLFRRWILPLIHSDTNIRALFQARTKDEREDFYVNQWANWRWRKLIGLFFSQFTMSRLGREPSFFEHASASLSEHVKNRSRYAMTKLDPAQNPYLQWVLTGQYITNFPYALREENFEPIRDNIDRLEWHNLAVEDYLSHHPGLKINHYNLSDIFEYMTPNSHQTALEQLIEHSQSGSRLLYWNMLVPRSRPKSLSPYLQPLSTLASELFARDKAFFYSGLSIEEVI